MQNTYADLLKKPNQNVGAGLPAIAVCQPIQLQLTHRHRRQASSHTDRVSPVTSSFRPLMTWQPHITVATIVEDNGCFLMVEELKGGRAVLNQPAGHLDPHETLTEAAVRETLEETGWDVEATGIVGIYLYTAPSNGVTYQRVCFIAKALKHHPNYQLDEGILRARWLTREELMELRKDWRSELIIRCIDDYLAGQRHSLELIRPSL